MSIELNVQQTPFRVLLAVDSLSVEHELRSKRVKGVNDLSASRGVFGFLARYFFSALGGGGGLLETLRSEDGYGRENVDEKVNSRSFNLHLDYSKSLTLSNVGEPS